MGTMLTENILRFVILLPFIGALIIGVGGLLSPSFRRQEGMIGTLATLLVAIPFAILLLVFFQYKEPVSFSLFSWMRFGSFSIDFSYRLDQLSIIMGLIVTGVGALIHLYSIGYMHGDPGYYRYFAFLNLFIFAMNNLVMGDNLVVTFLGWEGVGACSYFLIGFWFTDMLKAKAAQKAFIANRIGDFAFLIAMFLIFNELGTLRYEEIQGRGLSSDVAFWSTLLLFIAATGKSAQIPLYVWLPDAMAGPTPVSALIHAATMVTSGIYLISRMSWIYSTVPEVLLIICGVAALTAILAASIAIAQNDIKKVLAYSTVSQLGYMFMALGAGAYATAIFHVFTHAFFKACLFLGSGSVIHAMEHTHAVKDPQDIRTMGGLRKYMPSTSTTFWIATFAIAGIPPLAGFFSKDEILAKTFAMGHQNELYYVFWLIGVITAFLTAFYMTRLSYLTFEGEPRFQIGEHSPHESPAIMTIPLWILAFFSVIAGLFGLPEWIAHGEYHWIGHHWLAHPEKGVVVPSEVHLSIITELVLVGLSIIIALLGVLSAWKLYKTKGLEGDSILERKLGSFYEVLRNKYYVDELYQKWIIDPFVWIADKIIVWFDENIVDGIVDGIGSLSLMIGNGLKYIQTGIIRHYALLVWIGIVILVLYVIFGIG